MDELVFVRPSIELKDEALAFRDEFIKDGGHMHGSCGFLRHEVYEDWLKDLELIERGEKEGRLASTVLFGVSRLTGEIVGITDIRHKLNPDPNHLPSYVNGNIGGSIRPSKRGMGYGTKLLEMAILRAAEYGNKRLLVSCDKWNAVSEHNIVKCGGIFDNEVTEQDGNIIRRFWIDIYSAQCEKQ